MTQEILFSVIIPTYNRRELLSRCLESVNDCNYDKMETIVVDDGSTDDTASFIKTFYPNIIYIGQKNSGVASARNAGMQRAKGKYVAFLDSDDVWHPQRLFILENVLNKLPTTVGLVFNDMDKFIENKPSGKSYINEYFGLKSEDYIKELEHNIEIIHEGNRVNIRYGKLYNKLIGGNIIQPSCAVIRSDIIRQMKGFNVNYKVAEDSDFFLRIARFHDIAYVPMMLSTLEPPSVSSLSNPSNNILKISNTIEYIITLLDNESNLHIKDLLIKRLSKLHLLLGYHQLTDLRKNEARKSFVQSIRLKKFQLKAYSNFVISFLPTSLLSILKTLKMEFLKPMIHR